jgi:Domain of unknown function (DUF4395)
MAGLAREHFVQQQGFEQEDAAGCATRYPALMFQPRVVGVIVLVALVLQSAPLFVILAALLWWNALRPAYNPFDYLYNRLIAEPKRLQTLDPAPPPRRFAQGMAGTFMLVIGVCLLAGWFTAAWIVQGLLLVALTALVFGRFCLGSYIYYLLHGRIDFANHTLPWAHG